MSGVRSATAFAPASVANVAVGFDVLGFSFPALGDRVTVRRRPEGRRELYVAVHPSSVEDGELPTSPDRNTASAAVRSLLDAVGDTGAFDVEIHKGVPVAAGLGGSASSAVAGAVAANALLHQPLAHEDLLTHAVAGEAVASGASHADNVAPSLLGGLVACLPSDPIRAIRVALPLDLHCVVVHPRLTVETRQARKALPNQISLAQHVTQSGRLAGFLLACQAGDFAMLRETMRDDLIEPLRSRAVPGFDEVQRAAQDAGAIACSIAGSGPSVFAWVPSMTGGEAVAAAIVDAFAAVDLASRSWCVPLEGRRAELEEVR